MNKEYLIGIDLGGTNIDGGLVDLSGKIVKKISYPTEASKGKKQIIDKLVDMIQKLRKGHVMGVGIGVPGPIEPKKGVLSNPPNLPGWKNVNLKRILEEKVRLPIFIENDANCFALAEAKCGQGKKIDNVLCFTLGSGIGGGIVINGKLYTGTAGLAGELGHITVNKDEEMKCGAGQKGCLEVYSCSRGIEKRYKKILKKKATFEEIYEMVKKGKANKKVKQIIADAGEYLGVALANYINIFNPELMVLGGGLSKAKLITDIAIKTMKKFAMPQALKKVKVIVSKMQDPGIIGAASIINR